MADSMKKTALLTELAVLIGLICLAVVWLAKYMVGGGMQTSVTFTSVGGQVYPGPPRPTVATLMHQLKDGDPSVRRVAAHRLARFGRAAKGEVPALLDALRDSDSLVAFGCAHALCQIAPDDPRVLPALMAASRSNPDLPNLLLPYVFMQLRHGAGDLPERVSVLKELLDERYSPTNRAESARLLEEIGAPAMSACPLLLPMLGDANPEVRKCAAFALVAINPHDPTIIPPLIAASQSDGSLWMMAMSCVRKCYPDIEERSTFLAGMLSTTNVRVPRSRIIQELGALGPKAKPSFPALLEVLHDPDADVRFEAYWALAKIDSSAIPADSATQSLIPDGQSLKTWPGVLIILGIPWLLVALSVVLAVARRRYRYGKTSKSPFDRSGLEIGTGRVLERMLAIKHQAAAALFQTRRRRGMPVLVARTQSPAEPPEPSQSDLDRLTTQKLCGAWEPQSAQR
jgi:HEAT repeat protein